MDMQSLFLAAAAVFALNTGAFAADETYQSNTKIEKDASGNYTEKNVTTRTDAAGTTRTYEKEADVRVNANGDTDKSTTTQEVTDPKGLLNKQTIRTSTTEKIKDGVVNSSQTVTVNGKTVESETRTAPQQ